MILMELFDEKYPITVSKKKEIFGQGWHGHFDAHDGRVFHFVVEPSSDGGAVFSFFETRGSDEIIAKTGMGDAYRIFATAIDIMARYTKANTPEYVGFSADNSEPSRVKLYRRMLEKMLPHGYHLEVVDANEMTDFFIMADKKSQKLAA